MTGLLSPPLQRLTATRSPHPDPESVRLGPTSTARLKSTLQKTTLPGRDLRLAPTI